MDVRLKNNAVFQIVGPSGCGKTLFTVKLLSTHGIFQSVIRHIYWLLGISSENGGEHGETAKMLKKQIPTNKITFLNGFEEGWMEKPKMNDVLVIDDLFMEATKEKNFNNLFTKVARHRGVTVIFITQNMFQEGGQHRTRNLNVHYLVLFKNPRDRTVIDFIARQAYPHNKRFLTDAYKDATDETPHAYLFMDFTQECPDEIRVRTQIFNPSEGIIIYKQL